MQKHPEVLGHWHTLVENFSTSSLDFYDLVKAGIARREIPDLKITSVEWKESGVGSGKRVYLRISREDFNFDICAAPFGTGYFFSSWLARIPRVILDFICLLLVFLLGGILVAITLKMNQKGAAGCGVLLLSPLTFFGTFFALGCLVRYGDLGIEPTVLSMPITGFLYRFLFRPSTYFNEDTATMFRESVQHAVQEAVEAVTSAKGVRLTPELSREVSLSPVGEEEPAGMSNEPADPL